MHKLSSPQFKSLGAKQDSELLLVKSFTGVEPAEGNRTVKFTISTDAVDRDNDTINQKGWELEEFKNNPLVLWGHDSHSPPIGKVVDIGVFNGKLKATVEFVPADNPWVGEKAEGAYQMCKQGFINATSVGFMPLEWTPNTERSKGQYSQALDFQRQKLMELSICGIPSNPEALIERSVDKEWTEAVTDELVNGILAAGEERTKSATTEIIQEVIEDKGIPLNTKSRSKRERILRLLKLTLQR